MRLCLLILLSFLTGCGYHAAGSASHLPAGVVTLNVPTFATRAQQYHTEFAFTKAVISELNTRTRYRVTPDDNTSGLHADATLKGTILSEVASPLTYDSSSGQTSSYLITINASVSLVARDGKILYRNDSMIFREQYQSTQDLSAFIQEDSPAVQRIAHDFAQTLVANVLEAF